MNTVLFVNATFVFSENLFRVIGVCCMISYHDKKINMKTELKYVHV